MKSATLLSRCSEKDLFDLIWLLKEFESINIDDIIKAGKEIDGGMDPEMLLYSISTANLRESACGFAQQQQQSPKSVLKNIQALQKTLVKQLDEYLDKLPSKDLKKVITRIKRL